MADKYSDMSGAEKATDLCLAVIALAPVSMLRGVVLKDLWRWFVMPLGVQAIGMAEALGLALLLGWLTHTYVADDKPYPGIAGIVRNVLLALTIWGVGALYARFR